MTVGFGSVLRYAVFGAFALMVVVFVALRPDEFAQISTLRSILDDAAVLAVAAAGLTVVLAVGEFDLSFGSIAGFAGAVAVYAMVTLDVPIVPALLLAVLAALLAGGVNGGLVAYGRVPALIGTLAVGSVVLGLERALMDDKTVYDGIPAGFLKITESELLGLPVTIYISLAVVAAVGTFLSFTVPGRWIYATGSGEDAARISGIRTRRVRMLAFAIGALCAAIAGVLLMSRGASYYPSAGVGLLLPAYSACFLGWSAASSGRFHPVHTYFGVIFMGTMTTGLIMLQVASWVTDLVQGLVLGIAVLIARSVRRTA
ncbi:MAG: ABC transporter permease [Patulibacter sp.]|nr:ABC transporter permease [Patulibacter sp.]